MRGPDARNERGSDSAERFSYVFGGTVDPDEWHDADEDHRVLLVAGRFEHLDDDQVAVRTAAVTQLLEGEPEAVWPTAQRLASLGLAPDQVVNQLSIVLAQTLHELIETSDEIVGDDREAASRAWFERAYGARLDRLPVPEPDEVEAAVLAAVAEAPAAGLDELVESATERFPAWAGDPLMAHLVGDTVDLLLDDEDGQLVVLPGATVGYADGLRDGVVLTHVLNDAERKLGALTVSFDLAAFARVAEPTCAGRPLDRVSAEPGHLAWHGPEGWLDGFEPGTTLAVRVDRAGVVELDALPGPPPVTPEDVAAVARAYHLVADAAELPVTGEELVFGMLAEGDDRLREPVAPLDELCAAAGLDRRASEVVHDPELWLNRRRLAQSARIADATRGDTYLATNALAVLAFAGRAAGRPGDTAGGEGRQEARAALGRLDDAHVLSVVADELCDRDRWAEEEAAAGSLVAALRDAARHPDEWATVHYLAARCSEADGDLPGAERHLARAVETGSVHPLAIDRLAWYASDRGDAVRAAQLWGRSAPAPSVVRSLDTIEPFARAGRASLGRNERCWCGSGRKYKHCHLGVVEAPPLADRVGWLFRKAADYLDRSGTGARDAMVTMVAARCPDPDDEGAIMAVLNDPLVADLLLTEGGWFERFLAERGSLLPDDEALLAASWTTVARTVYEVVSVDAGAGLTLRDLRTGDLLDVREATSSRHARPQTLLCARAVPDGSAHQIVGGAFTVVPGREKALLDVLDGGDPYEIAAWVTSA